MKRSNGPDQAMEKAMRMLTLLFGDSLQRPLIRVI
jgi:hypothetical protein